MSDLTKVPQMCSSCSHQEVCKFKDQAANFEDKQRVEDGPFTATISCKHYATIQLFVPRGFETMPTPWEPYKQPDIIYCGDTIPFKE